VKLKAHRGARLNHFFFRDANTNRHDGRSSVSAAAGTIQKASHSSDTGFPLQGCHTTLPSISNTEFIRVLQAFTDSRLDKGNLGENVGIILKLFVWKWSFKFEDRILVSQGGFQDCASAMTMVMPRVSYFLICQLVTVDFFRS
jgi:hypothetical protein